MGDVKTLIKEGKAVLGIEFGSTRIKGVLIDDKGTPIAQGDHEWENRLTDGIWTYTLEDVREGIQDCYAKLVKDVQDKYGVELTALKALGVSAMMHGYLAFDQDGKQLAQFRTWRNTMTGEASEKLTELFGFRIPQRWSIAHLYQAILNKEEHLKDVNFFTTLAGYAHWMLTGEKVLGVGDASGMFPIDSTINNYDEKMLDQFQALPEVAAFDWKIRDILPKVLLAGESAGTLTKEGALFLDPTGKLQPGAVVCPPEGDAGTGMVATNSVAERTGNVSAGTSFFSMIVLEKALSKVYPTIDMVTTPSGAPVAMVHCNNGTSDLNKWVNLFGEFAKAAGMELSTSQLYALLYNKALEGDRDCGGLLSYCFFAGEDNIGMEGEGRPLFVHKPDSKFNLANFMRSHLFTSLGVLRLGSEILEQEGVKVDRITGHGGLFKTPVVGQQILAAAMKAPVSVMETAGEGGAWGIALLAAYVTDKKEGQDLGTWLEEDVFAGSKGSSIEPQEEDMKGFAEFMERFNAGLAVEKTAIENLK